MIESSIEIGVEIFTTLVSKAYKGLTTNALLGYRNGTAMRFFIYLSKAAADASFKCLHSGAYISQGVRQKVLVDMFRHLD